VHRVQPISTIGFLPSVRLYRSRRDYVRAGRKWSNYREITGVVRVVGIETFGGNLLPFPSPSPPPMRIHGSPGERENARNPISYKCARLSPYERSSMKHHCSLICHLEVRVERARRNVESRKPSNASRMRMSLRINLAGRPTDHRRSNERSTRSSSAPIALSNYTD